MAYDDYAEWTQNEVAADEFDECAFPGPVEPPSDGWRAWWKARAPAHRVDVEYGGRVGDLELTPGVVELHQGAISAADVREREAFWEDVIWLVDARTMDLRPIDGAPGRWTWREPVDGFLAATSAVFFDLGGPVLVAERIVRERGRVVVEGSLHPLAEVLEWLQLRPLETASHHLSGARVAA